MSGSGGARGERAHGHDYSGPGGGARSRGSGARYGGAGGKGGGGGKGGTDASASGEAGTYGRGGGRRRGGGNKASFGRDDAIADSGGSQGSGSSRDSPMQCDSSGAGSEGGEGGGEGNLALLCRAAFEFASTCSPLQTGSSAAVPPLGGRAHGGAGGPLAPGSALAHEDARVRNSGGGGGGFGSGGGGFGSLGAGAGAMFLPSVTTWYQAHNLNGLPSMASSAAREAGGGLGAYEDMIVKREREGEGDAGSGSSSTPELGVTVFAAAGGVPSIKSQLQASSCASPRVCVVSVLCVPGVPGLPVFVAFAPGGLGKVRGAWEAAPDQHFCAACNV